VISILKYLKRSQLHVAFLVLFIVAIALLVFLDYFNLESIAFFNQRGFYFDYTWKGRLFLLFFLWLFVLEFLSLTKTSKDVKIQQLKNFRIAAALICAAIPIIYIFSVNFLGLNQIIVNFGDILRGEYWRAHFRDWDYIMGAAWPLSFEYLVFTFSFLGTILFAYGKSGLKNYSLSFGLIAGISLAYFLDVYFPYGVLRPFQIMTLPTAALAAGVLEILNYPLSLTYYTMGGSDSMPGITLYTRDAEIAHSVGSASIAWPCAGVHSLFLYTLIILLLFKKSDISGFRKLAYFVVGAIGTYTFNILRITSYFIILYHNGKEAAFTFHDVYGDLYSVVWILSYMLLIISVEKFGLVEKTKQRLYSLLHFLKLKKKEATQNQLSENEINL